MPRFYCPTPITPGELLDLPASAARHVQVLRLQPGDVITLFNGGPDVPSSIGGEYEATVTQMGRSHVQVQVGAHMAVEREAALQVHLAVGMPANERMDWLVEKATELGVSVLWPVITRHTVAQRVNIERLTAHAREAAEQCERLTAPEVREPVALEKALAAWPKERLLFHADESGKGAPIAQALTGRKEAPHAFLIGPEGGFAPAELDLLAQCAFVVPIGLGPRLLRAETAALAALSCRQALCGAWDDRPPPRPHL